MQAYQRDIETHPAGFPQWLCALDFLHGEPRQIVVAGSAAAANALWPVIRGRFLPSKVVMHTVDGKDAITRLAPVALGKSAARGAMVYVCRNFACQAPVDNADALGAQLTDVTPQGMKGD